MSKPVALSFFSGAMGLDLGIEKAGFDIKLVCENDKHCQETIELNRPDIPLIEDINDYEAHEVRDIAGLEPDEDIDLIVGGPPCQAFSTAGNRQGLKDERGNVFLEYLELCIDLNPKYFIVENVRGLLSTPISYRPHNMRGDGYPSLNVDELRGGALNVILSLLDNSGYGYSFELYNAANFGTPQNRERIIMVCSRDGNRPPFLTPTHSENGEHGLPKWNTLRSCISDLTEHDHVNFSEKRLKYYRYLTEGQCWRHLPEELQEDAMGKSYHLGGGKTGSYRRLAWDRPSPTVLTSPTMFATSLAHPVEDRPLSIQEYKRIQEFPDGWKLFGTLRQQYKQVGNAVPVGLGYAVGTMIRKLLDGEMVRELNSLKISDIPGIGRHLI